ncbi:MAG: hypothetical protein ABJB86_04215 [Bacteroidota bacterium]
MNQSPVTYLLLALLIFRTGSSHDAGSLTSIGKPVAAALKKLSPALPVA